MFDKPTERNIELFIEKSAPDMVALQTLLTRHPALAPESGGIGESEKCQALEKWLIENGVPQDSIEHYDAPDSRVPSGKRPNIVVTLKGNAPASGALWIISHTDVVPEGERSLWKSDPWIVHEKDGRIFGRGVTDNQQGLVSGVFALLSFLKNNLTPFRTIKLLFSADEEVGSKYGIRYLLEQHKNIFSIDDLILIPDSGNVRGDEIEIAEKNLLWMRFCVRGKQAHGSRPDEGNNAFLAASNLILELNALEKVFDAKDLIFSPPYSTFQPTKKEANVPNVNTIPGMDVFYFDCRILPCYPLAIVKKEIEERIKKIETDFSVKIEAQDEQAVESPATDENAPVVRLLKKAIKQVYAVDAHLIGIGGGTVGSYLRNAGFPCAIWSCLDEVAHEPNEYCTISNMVNDAKVFARIALAEEV